MKFFFFFFFKQKTAYEIRPCDWSSDVCSSDLRRLRRKLDQYYASEGEGERLRIVFDPGSYAPHFVESALGTPKRTWPSMRHLAVLPLQSLSRDAEGIEFASGLTEDLISALARTAGLQVVARAS